MNAAASIALVALGAVIGFAAAHQLIKAANPSSCCKRVQDGFREKVADTLGEPFAYLADALGLTKSSPQLLDTLGVP